jgi:hypothetical protein
MIKDLAWKVHSFQTSSLPINGQSGLKNYRAAQDDINAGNCIGGQ